MKKNSKKTGIGAFFRSFGLLLRCLFTAVSFSSLWVGIALHSSSLGVRLIIIGALTTLLSVFVNIIVPLIKLK